MPDGENKGISEGADLSGNLNDSGVKFQDSGWRAMKNYREPTTSKIIQWTMKCSGGLIKNEKQANYALLGFVILAIIVSLFLIFSGGKETNIPASGIYTDEKTPPKFITPTP